MACRLGHLDQIEPGPPPVTYRPPMPPKFLPVPTRPVFANVNPNAPNPDLGGVEFGYEPQLTFPGRD